MRIKAVVFGGLSVRQLKQTAKNTAILIIRAVSFAVRL